MERRIDRGWVVLRSLEDGEHARCVDVFRRPDGSFGFEEFRRDVEERTWTPVQFFSERSFPSQEAALASARHFVRWLGEVLDAGRG
jgi:hypothetical protein